MSAITPQTALPARSVTPSGAVTCNSSRLRLYAVIDATQGEASLKLVRQLEGGDWQYVPGGSLSISAYSNAADKVNELIVPNAGAGTVYHVVGVGSSAVLGTIRVYLAEIVDSVVTGTATVDGVQTLTNKTLTSPTLTSPTLTTATTSGNFTFGGKIVASASAFVIADPGTGQAIPVTTSGVCMITTAAAETNTLAIPTFVGQRLAIICDTYAVGNRVITSAQAINQAGNTIMTFGAAADMIELTAMKVGGALRWRVTANDGVALS